MKKVNANWIISIMAMALLLFTASRTWDLLIQLLPDDGWRPIIAATGLLAFDGGLIGWHMVHTHGARGKEQRAISQRMTYICLVATIITLGADLYIDAALKGFVGKLSSDQKNMVLAAVIVVVAVNVWHFILYFQADPEIQEQAATREAQDTIAEARLKMIQENAPYLAQLMAPQGYHDWASRQIGMLNQQQASQLPAPQGQAVPPTVVNAAPPVAAPTPPQSIIGKIAGLFGGGQQQAPASLAQTATVQQPANVPPTPAQQQPVWTGPRPPLPAHMHEAEQRRHAQVLATRRANRQRKLHPPTNP